MDDKYIVEAALFMAGRDIKIKEISRVTSLPWNRVLVALNALIKEYGGRGDALEIIKTENGYKMKVRDAYLPHVAQFSKLTDISEGEAKTLGVVALNQPVPQSYVVKIRGNKAYAQLKKLEAAGFVRSEPRGRTRTYTVTQKFKEYFGAQAEEMKRMIEAGELKPKDEDEDPGEKPDEQP